MVVEVMVVKMIAERQAVQELRGRFVSFGQT
jgi:hypothetical protein